MDSFANIPKMEQRDETILKGAQRTKFDFDKNFDHSNIPLKDEKFPVIIIGSSMVGMSLGVLLGYYGVKSISFDRHPSTAIHPRAALFLLRTIEIFRQLGLADLMEQESVLNFDLDAGMLVVESLVGGKVLMRIQESDPAKTAEVTPAKRLWLTQNMFEPLLRTEAHRFGAQQKFSTNVVHYEEQADGVIVIVQDLETKKYFKYKTDYLVATDGSRSATRKFEGIEWRGPGIQSNNISVNFRADLTPYLGSRAVHGVTYITNPKISAGFRLEGAGKAGFMIVSSTKDRQEFEPNSVTADEAKQYFCDASGIKAEIDIQVDSVSYWTAAAFNADHYSSKRGRVFLAGDAAHVVPPTGGMGGNTGIQDTYNLAWKLAYVVQGKAAPNLLKTYSEERKPTVERVMQQAYSRLVNRVSEDKSVPHEKELPDIICEIGYRYVNGAFIRSTAPVASEPWEDPHAPTVTPGSRIPHVMLTDHANGDAQVSTLDLVKQNFILFTADPSSPWLAAVSKQKIKVDAYGISKDSQPLADTADKFAKTLKLDSEEAILVRPDGHIAWRGSSEDGQEQSTVESVLQEILWG